MNPRSPRTGATPARCLIAVLLLLFALPAAPAFAADPPVTTTAVARVHRLTLITGDVVTHTVDRDGRSTADIDAAESPGRPEPSFGTMTTPDGFFVYPSDALPFVSAGVLDRNLFNLSALAEDGRDDSTSGTIPVIADYDGEPGIQSLEQKADALAAAETRSVLPTASAVGLRVDKARAGEFWESLTAGSPRLRHDVARLTLDRRVRVVLDKSTAQVGAPAAWQAGLDGTGSTVAVVDTGIDAGHPDLAGKVTASADFSGEGDVVDRHGHGTHVASIAAGTGAASGGKYRGVAPAAKLVVAKVFDSSGAGDTSQVMAGIDWAVGTGAKIVNLSLGAGVTDGADPLSEQVDELSAKTGTLFVVAAGNSGPGDRTVTTPGSAAAALTVGAVDDAGKLAWFSSRGPRLRDALVKPELTAPGVEIAAARASGTAMGAPVDENYTSASGTSMATPHVAGAAALLLQQHPQWTGQALKNALASTAKDLGLRWFEQGAGLLDLNRVVSQPATGPATASFGRLERTPAGTAVTERTLAYTNESDQPLALSLSLSVQQWDGGKPPPDGVKLGTSTLSVPPKSTGQLTVTADPAKGAPGVYGGTVVASTPDGKTVLRTPLSTYHAPPLFPVTLRVLDSAGKPASMAAVQLIDDSGGTAYPNDPMLGPLTQQVDLVGGTGQVSLPAGRYSALGWVMERGLAVRRWSALSVAEASITGPAQLTLDATKAVPVDLVTPAPTDQRDRTVMLRRVLPSYVGEAGLTAGATAWQVRATPAPATKTGEISLQDTASLAQSTVAAKQGGTTLNPVYDVPTLAAAWPGEHTAPVVFAGAGRAEDFTGLDVKGKIALVRIPVPPGAADPVAAVFQGAVNAATQAAAAGAVAVVPYAGVPGALPITGLTSTTLPQLSLGWDQGELVRQAGTPLTLLVRAAPELMYNLSYLDANGVPAAHVRQVDHQQLVATRTGYHADLPGLSAQKNFYAFPTGRWKTQPLQGTKIPVPGSWTEYTGPGDDRQVWKRVVTQSGPGPGGKKASLAMHQQNIYRPGEKTRPDEHWFRAPVHSTAVELRPDHPARYPATADGWRVLCSLCRSGDLFAPALQWADSEGGHFTSPYENGKYFTTTETHLYRGDTEIPRDNAGDPFAQFPVYRLAPEPAVYRLSTVDVLPAQAQIGAPSTSLFAHAPRTETTWTFASARTTDAPPPGYHCHAEGTACAFQPLILLDHRFPLDLGNRAPAGGPFEFEITAAEHSGARGGGPVTQLKTAYSTDDGVTWTAATAKPLGDARWTVTVQHPPQAGAVSLRTEAKDSAGNTVTSTTLRAYLLAAPSAG
ncbi:S8 family peptidase [Amycolatopsis sp. 195334CR]|uniref:S8 family peptidase n=1 Tax=Amycolatopsis sp. 195334CR TaxID=2814588 RepID=UPI001A900883|nr:S8 family peptidase [Amycolatopsis sp. 195334CR]MBN6042076.1 S8 family serine peptidase [Amycolatopsis sp. 195334CR]